MYLIGNDNATWTCDSFQIIVEGFIEDVLTVASVVMSFGNLTKAL
jgi:hypothetical protein